jgi:hypothetical protein
MAPFEPSRADVYRVRALLASRKLPNELILAVLDHAHYWVERQHYWDELTVIMDEEFSTEFSAASPLIAMSAYPYPRRPQLSSEPAKIKEIEFLLVSHGKHRPTSMWWAAALISSMDDPRSRLDN